jgi:SAM-dependent methyltransferase
VTESTTPEGLLATTQWSDASAKEWLAGSATSGRLQEMQTAWRFAAAVIGSEQPDPEVVVDVASGSGRFLSVLLDRFPDARGIWSDPFETMLADARDNLARFGDRVDYRPADLADLGTIVAPGEVDVVTTSRITHHLSLDDLGRLYATAFQVLRPGGWLVNADNVRATAPWDRRLKAAKAELRTGPRGGGDGHPHLQEPATLDDHLGCLRAAGFPEIEVAWKNAQTVVLVARKDVDEAVDR